MPDSPDKVIDGLLRERKSQQAAVLLTLKAMEEQIAEQGWDRPPWLYLMYRSLPPMELAEQLMKQAGGMTQMMAIQPLGILPSDSSEVITGAMANLADTLRTQRYGINFAPALGDDMVAWVMTTEGWGVSATVDQPDKMEEINRAGREHSIHTRPDRIEVRILMAVDRTGMRYQLTHERDGALWASIHEADSPALDGSMIQALSALMEATP